VDICAPVLLSHRSLSWAWMVELQRARAQAVCLCVRARFLCNISASIRHDVSSPLRAIFTLFRLFVCLFVCLFTPIFTQCHADATCHDTGVRLLATTHPRQTAPRCGHRTTALSTKCCCSRHRSLLLRSTQRTPFATFGTTLATSSTDYTATSSTDYTGS
jgi:hypothetical protein